MAGSVSITGPGSYETDAGVKPGWSIQEDVPSHVPTDGANSTGTASFGVGNKSDGSTNFLQDNDSVFSVTKGDNSSFGLLAGKINSVNQQGINSGLTQGSALTRFNADRLIPAVGSGSPVAALDLAMQLTGTKFSTLNYPGGIYWSARGHDVGFDNNNNPVTPYDAGYSTAQNIGLLSRVTQTQNVRNSLTVSSYGQNTVRSQYMFGSSPTVTPGQRTLVMYTDIATNYNSFQATYGPYNYTVNAGKNINVYVDKVAQTVRIKGNYTTGGTLTAIDVSSSITAPLTASLNVQILIDLNWVNATTFNVTAYVANIATPGTYVTVTTGNLATGNDTYSLRWNMAGIVQAVYTLDADQTFTPSALMVAYDNASSYTATGFTTYLPDNPISPFSGTVWNYLSQVCSATQTEIYNAISGNTTIPGIRPIGAVTVTPDSWAISPSISVSNQGVGQNIQVKNYNTSVVSSKQIYDARQAGDEISFAPGTTTQQTITTQNSIEFVFNPVPYTDYTQFSYMESVAIDPTIGNRTNYVTNPDFETGIAGWTNTASATLGWATSPVYIGTHSMSVTTSATLNAGVVSNPVAFTSDWANQVVGGNFKLYANGGAAFQISLMHSTASGPATIATTTYNAPGPAQWSVPQLSGTMLPTATSGAYWSIVTATATAQTFYIDSAIIEITTADPGSNAYFNGNSISDISTTYGWNGVPNASTSYAHQTGGTGGYLVADSSGVIIDPYLWVSYGGNIQATVIDANHIGLSITAPVVPGYDSTGNYSLSAGTLPTLYLMGSGVLSTPVTLNYATGADPKFVTALNGPGVDNVAIGSAVRANTAAAFTSNAADGPTLQFSGVLNMETFSGLSGVGGSTFVYQNQRWRIVSSTVDNLTVSVNAIPYTTVGDFETAWSGKTISQFETFWSGYLHDDYNIQPLKIT